MTASYESAPQRPATPYSNRGSGASTPAPQHQPSISSADTLHAMTHVAPGDTIGPSSSAPATPGDSISGYDGPRLPKMPQIGLDEHVYSRMSRKADDMGDRHAREAAKVGMYITLALNPKMSWRDKLRHFEHALHKHCHVEKLADHRLWKFYHALAHLVREHCGAEALRLASHEDDMYAARLSMGTARADIEREAARFFDSLIGRGKECPDYMLHDEFLLIRMIRDQWI